MTDQKYKLVPAEPTEEMFRAIYHRLPTLALNVKEVHEALCAAIAAAPEPVCRWVSHELHDNEYFVPLCGGATRPWDEVGKFCPHCRRKVEVVDSDKSP